jgi:hypothetical protein
MAAMGVSEVKLEGRVVAIALAVRARVAPTMMVLPGAVKGAASSDAAAAPRHP